MSQHRSSSRFTRAYTYGVPELLGPPRRPLLPDGMAVRGRDASGRARHRQVTTAAAAEAFALHGTVITASGSWASGYVVVADGVIDDVRQAPPDPGLRVLETDGVILPGLIDLHGHPEFNVFAAWEPPELYANRYRWRQSDLYHQLVRDPQNLLLTKLPAGTELQYAEVRALAGGVTAIQGASGTSRSTPGPEPLVRNVDLWIFGDHRARAMIDLPSGTSGRDYPRLQNILGAITAGQVDAFYLHLCEGRRDDQRSASEFRRFLDLGAATPATVVIHGSALGPDQLHTLADAGCRLVWSPQSNLRLYGQTTLAGEALAAGMPVALGADWLPSGSTSLLAEMKVARRELAQQGHPIPAADLVAMVTSGAARIAGLDQHLGSITPGRPADLLVLERRHEDPYENVCAADPSWVELVTIGGDLTYARTDWYTTLAADPGSGEDLIAWGKPMRIDTSFGHPDGQTQPTLTRTRADLIGAYPQVGPIYA
jgi:5-methylthioadenosine/S-adenosylhomocysteine deaminase